MSKEGFLDLSKFKKQKKIGQGGFSEVFKILERGSGKVYACKISLKEIDLNSKEDRLNICREVNIIASIQHPSILKFVGYSPTNFNHEPRPVLITEYSSNGSLERVLELERNGRSPLGWDQTKKLIVIYGIAAGMAYLHSNNILHRDLKPDNILLDDFLLPKIADFGLSKIYHSPTSIKSPDSTPEIKGTPAYIAPEIWAVQEYTKATDVYSFALIVYEIMTSEIPFQGLSMIQIMQKVGIQRCRPKFRYPIPDSYRKLIEDCWSQIPTKRPSFQEIAEILKTDTGFLTEGVEEIDFFDYIDFIDKSIITYKATRNIIEFSDYINPKTKTFIKVKIDQPPGSPVRPPPSPPVKEEQKIVYPQKDFIKLSSSCQKLVQEADSDIEKQFLVGRNLFEGINGFPKNLELGIQYLKRSIKKGSIDSTIYFSRILIEGKLIPPNLEKAEKYLKLYLPQKNATIYTLYGKAQKNQYNYDEALKYFKKASSAGNAEGMYEYGMMFCRGEGVPIDIERGNEYIEMARENGFQKVSIGDKNSKQNSKTKLPDRKITIIKHSIFDKLECNCQSSVVAAESGDENSLVYVGRCFIEGSNNFPVNEKLGLKYLEHAADLKIVEALLLMGKLYLNGNLVPKNEKKAVSILNEAATISKSSEMKLQLVDILLSRNTYDVYSTDCKNVNYPLIKKYCKEAADLGNTKAMVLYGLLCMKVKKNKFGEIKSDYNEALRYFKLAAESGDAEGMVHYGSFIEKGYGIVEPDVELAVKYYKMACKKENMSGYAHYGASLIEGEGIPKNEAEGIRLVKKSCDNKNPVGMAYYGYFLHIGLSRLKRDVNQAVCFYKRAADLGCAYGMANYGLCLRDGICVQKDTKAAVKYFKLAFEEGNLRAAFYLGNTLSNLKEGNRYLQYAADHGIKQAMHQFALNIYSRRGIDMNIKLLIKYLTNGINMGCQSCMILYGTILMKGDVLPTDKYEGVRYFKMAADLGDQRAMKLYAESLEKGVGIMKNVEKAKKYKELASRCERSLEDGLFIYS